MPAMTAPPADEFAAAFTDHGGQCRVLFLGAHEGALRPRALDYILPLRRQATPGRLGVEGPNVNARSHRPDSASQFLGADIIDDVATQRELARQVCERPVSPSPQPQLITEE